jgi:hypothetical protein
MVSVTPPPARRMSRGPRAVASRCSERHPTLGRCPTTCHQVICPRFHKLLRPGLSQVPFPLRFWDLRGRLVEASLQNARARRGYTVMALDGPSSAHVPPVHASQIDSAARRAPQLRAQPTANVLCATYHKLHSMSRRPRRIGRYDPAPVRFAIASRIGSCIAPRSVGPSGDRPARRASPVRLSRVALAATLLLRSGRSRVHA